MIYIGSRNNNIGISFALDSEFRISISKILSLNNIFDKLEKGLDVKLTLEGLIKARNELKGLLEKLIQTKQPSDSGRYFDFLNQRIKLNIKSNDRDREIKRLISLYKILDRSIENKDEVFFLNTDCLNEPKETTMVLKIICKNPKINSVKQIFEKAKAVTIDSNLTDNTITIDKIKEILRSMETNNLILTKRSIRNEIEEVELTNKGAVLGGI